MVAALAWLPGTASAAYPGANGRIAYVGHPTGETQWDLYTILPDGTGLERLTNDPALESDPSWSPDGRRIVFVTGGADGTSVEIANADGSERLPLAQSDTNASPTFSPSGRRIIYTSGDTIRTIRTDGTDPRRILRSRVGDRGLRPDLRTPEYSPDGKRIAFAGAPRGDESEGIWTMRRNGSGLRRLTNPGTPAEPDVYDTELDYRPDGRRIVFFRDDGFRGGDIYLMRADGSDEHEIPNTVGFRSPAFSPTGDRIVMATIQDYVSPDCTDIYTITPRGFDRRRVTPSCLSGYPATTSGARADEPNWQPVPGATP